MKLAWCGHSNIACVYYVCVLCAVSISDLDEAGHIDVSKLRTSHDGAYIISAPIAEVPPPDFRMEIGREGKDKSQASTTASNFKKAA